MNKYYTPDIEEFHVGFEYEYKSSNNWHKNTYDGSEVLKSKSYFDDHGCEYDAIEDDIKENLLRVKYLDKEDIESFGFKYCKTNRLTYWYEIEFSGNNLPGGSSYKYWKIELLHYPKDNTITIKSDTSDAENYTFFEGNIKNKSELKRLLKQLNIK